MKQNKAERTGVNKKRCPDSSRRSRCWHGLAVYLCVTGRRQKKLAGVLLLASYYIISYTTLCKHNTLEKPRNLKGVFTPKEFAHSIVRQYRPLPQAARIPFRKCCSKGIPRRSASAPGAFRPETSSRFRPGKPFVRCS